MNLKRIRADNNSVSRLLLIGAWEAHRYTSHNEKNPSACKYKSIKRNLDLCKKPIIFMLSYNRASNVKVS